MHNDMIELMAAVPMPLILIGPKKKILRLNPAALRLIGPGFENHSYVAALRQPEVLDSIERSYDLGTAQSARFSTSGPARVTKYEVQCAPVDLEDGEGVLLSFTDASDRDDAEQMRSDFIANVSHELRTPLTALLGFIETLRGPASADHDARERFLITMEREAWRMNRLVHDLLSLSRVESEGRQHPDTKTDLGAVVGTVIQTLKTVSQDADVDLHFKAPDPSIVTTGDTDQLQQVVSNLIENAIKYGGSGKTVTVTITRVENEPVLRGPGIRLAVMDQGEGIDPLHIPRLTERFYRIDSHRSREVGGTGLGLAIVKHIINRHRGRLKIESKRGQGSVFTVLLPAS